jgi:hypothetical protein
MKIPCRALALKTLKEQLTACGVIAGPAEA